MKNFRFKGNSEEIFRKIEQVLEQTVIHRRPFVIYQGKWPFVVLGADKKGNSVIRAGYAEQSLIKKAPVYIATVGGDYIAGSEGIPIEELAGGDVPEEVAGLKVFHMSPMRPVTVTARKDGPPLKEAVSEALERYDDNATAVIETPDEAHWIISVLKYLDESDRFSGDPVMEHFYSRLARNTDANIAGRDIRFKH
jgi:hypothetical protein